VSHEPLRTVDDVAVDANAFDDDAEVTRARIAPVIPTPPVAEPPVAVDAVDPAGSDEDADETRARMALAVAESLVAESLVDESPAAEPAAAVEAADPAGSAEDADETRARIAPPAAEPPAAEPRVAEPRAAEPRVAESRVAESPAAESPVASPPAAESPVATPPVAAPAVAPADLPADGAPFGRFRLMERLGGGGVVDVYRARIDEPDGAGRQVVVKRVRADRKGHESLAERLASEARVSARLVHPAIARVEESGEIDGERYLVRELVDGYDLSRVLRACRLRQTPLPPAVACHVIGELAAALAYAHALVDDGGQPLDIIHGNVCPANVMVAHTGEVKLIDFGAETAPVDGFKVDRNADLLALGALFHECLVLRRVGEPDSPPSELVEGIPTALDEIIARLLAVEPGEGYASCDEVVAALAPLRADLGGDATALKRALAELDGALPRRSAASGAVPVEESIGHASTLVARKTGSHSRRPQPSGEPEAERGWRWRWAITGAAVVLAFAVPALLRMQARPPSVRTTPLATTTVTAPAPSVAAPAPPVAVPAPSVAAPAPPVAVPAPPVAAPAPVAATPSPAPVAATVRLRVRGPEGARALVDDVPVGVLPLDVSLPSTPGHRRLVVTQPGHRAWSRTIAGNVDVALFVDLVKAAAPAPPSQSQRVRIRDPFSK
jgi:hypothetical protein